MGAPHGDAGQRPGSASTGMRTKAGLVTPPRPGLARCPGRRFPQGLYVGVQSQKEPVRAAAGQAQLVAPVARAQVDGDMLKTRHERPQLLRGNQDNLPVKGKPNLSSEFVV